VGDSCVNKPFHFTKNRKPFLLTWTWTSRTLCAFSKPILPLPKELPESKYLPLRACSPRQCPPNFFPRPTLLRTASYRSPAFAQEKITLSPSPYIPPSLPPSPSGSLNHPAPTLPIHQPSPPPSHPYRNQDPPSPNPTAYPLSPNTTPKPERTTHPRSHHQNRTPTLPPYTPVPTPPPPPFQTRRVKTND